MRPESAKRIIDAYFDVFDQLSIQTFNQGLGFVLNQLEERLRLLRSIRTREGFQAQLLKEPEPDPSELDAQVEAIYLMPYTIRKALPEAIHEMAQIFPNDPGGRVRILTDKESRYVCEETGKLFAQGVALVDAQKRLAARMSKKKGKEVSLRTVQRAWQSRSKWFNDHAENTSSFTDRIAKRWRKHVKGLARSSEPEE